MAAAATRLVLSFMCLFQATADLCLQNLPEYSNQRNGNPAQHFMGKTQAIIPAYSFNCSGNVTRWGAYVEPGGSSEVYYVNFQVWRPSQLQGCYALVGSNQLEQVLPINNQITLEVPEEEQIQVQPRDVMGFYTKHWNGSGGIRLSVSTATDSMPVWYAREITSTDTGACQLSVGEDRTLNSMLNRKPVVTAVIGRQRERPTPTLLSSSTTSTLKSVTIPDPADPIQPSEDDAEDKTTLAAFLAVGASMGCIVTIIVVVAVGIYVSRRKRASEVEDDLQGHANGRPAIDNISYAPQKIFPTSLYPRPTWPTSLYHWPTSSPTGHKTNLLGKVLPPP